MVRTMKVTALAVLALALIGFFTPVAQAVEGAGGPRGSALIFPYYNTTAGHRTFLRVTHAGMEGDLGFADVALHTFYVETVRNPFDLVDECREFNRFRPITHDDAEVWDIRAEFPNATRGFAITYLVERFEILGVITFGGSVGWDTLFGETVVLNSTEGWIAAVQSVPVRWDHDVDGDGVPDSTLGLGLDQQFVVAQAEGPSFGGPDFDLVDYHFVTFGNEFDMHFFNPNVNVDPTDYVILPFSIIPSPFGDGSFAWVQPLDNLGLGSNRFQWTGDWFDHDENQHNMPADEVLCWGFRSLPQIAPGAEDVGAPAGYGWIRLRGINSLYTPGGEMAVIYQLEDPVPNAGFGWGFYPARRANNLFLVSDGPFLTPGAFPYNDPVTLESNDGKTTVEQF